MNKVVDKIGSSKLIIVCHSYHCGLVMSIMRPVLPFG